MFFSFISLLLALALDYRFSEPKKYHPLVGFGRYVDFLQRRFNRTADLKSRQVKGVIAGLLAITPIVGLIALIQYFSPTWLTILIDITLLYLCIGWSSLQQHANAIYDELKLNQLDLAREKLSRIVSRKTNTLDQTQVAQASVESVLENSLDALFATLFWFMVAGIEGAVLHRLVNTLDAMWGYKTENFLYFGRFVARFDDVLNYIPARFTAYGFALCASSVEQSKKALACWKSQAKQCSSPNGGPVMTAGAGALNVRLSSGGYYVSTSATTSTAQQNKMQATATLGASVEWHEKPVMGCGEPAQMETIMASLALVQRTLVLWLLTLGGIIFVF